MDLVRTLGVAIDAAKAEQGGGRVVGTFKEVGKSAIAAEKAVDGAGSAINRTGGEMQRSSRAGDVLRETLHRQNAVLATLTAATERLVAILSKEKSAVASVTTETQRATRAMLETTNASKNVTTAFDAQAKAMKSAGDAARDAGAKIDKAGQQSRDTAGRFTGSSTALSKGFGVLRGAAAAFGVAISAAALATFAQDMVRTEAQVQRTANALRYASEDAADFARNQKFAKEVAAGLGLELQSSSREFAKFLAAGKGTEFSGDELRNVFLSVAKASTVLGLTSEETAGTLNALQQMISKGTVQAEELRGQLGERLPGAFQLAAKAMGVTTQELGKMLERGEVTAYRLLPALAREMEKAFGKDATVAAGSLQSEINRLSSAWTDFKSALFQSGIGDFLTGVAKQVRSILTETAGALRNIKSLGGGIGSFIPGNLQGNGLAAAGIGMRLAGGGAFGDPTGTASRSGAVLTPVVRQSNREFSASLDEAMGFSRGSVTRSNRQPTGAMFGLRINGEDAAIRSTTQQSSWLDVERARVQQNYDTTMQPMTVGRPFLDGMQKAVKELPNEFQRLQQIGYGTAQSLEDNFGRFTDMMIEAPDQIGKAFRELFANILRDIAQLTLRQAVVSPIVGALTTALGGVFGGPTTVAPSAAGSMGPVFHGGGVAGVTPTTMRPINAAMFHNAPRFHQGLAPDEIPAIIQRGERIIPKGKSAESTNITNINVTVDGSKGGTPDQNEQFGREIAQQIEAMMDERLARAMQPRGMLYQSYNA